MPANQPTAITTFTQVNDQYFTPEHLIRAVKQVLGTIELDPASCKLANRTVQAKEIYTASDNGLERMWFGKVFCNPPSKAGDPTAKPHLWAKRMALEYETQGITEGLLLVKSVLGYKWYEQLYQDYWVCHLRERPEFIVPRDCQLVTIGKAKKGCSMFYFGKNVKRFYTVFKEYGKIVPPVIYDWIAQALHNEEQWL